MCENQTWKIKGSIKSLGYVIWWNIENGFLFCFFALTFASAVKIQKVWYAFEQTYGLAFIPVTV